VLIVDYKRLLSLVTAIRVLAVMRELMTLQTDRLNLRQLSITDIDKIHELHSLPETDQFNTLGIPETIQTTEQIVNEWLVEQNAIPRTSYIFCIHNNETKQFIGLIALLLGKPNFRTAEIWYKIHIDYWRQGYTTEALNKLLDFGFNDMGLHRIEAGCAVENIASSKVLEKAGMTKEGMKRKKLPIRGEWKDNYFYAMLEEDFLKLSK
jgi:ribosomal-protein-alanine N-acetyltransferase